ncbi:hypothetical protein [Sphingorhabdus sp. Alg239-R122]|uniref:hypothetical protein n=1 Tax=Sphingorhabdus sp. Alg239-R122 TaxID=2305989 RepID=UPI0013DB26E5|nr:hypothetical protein [Sphingorhabdus sp. Alg239-R122]
MKNTLLLPVIFGCALNLVACSSEQSTDSASSDSDGWSVVSNVDKFTDAKSRIAQKTFETETTKIEAQVQCRGSKQMVYTFTAFGSDGEGLPFRTRTGQNAYGNIITVSEILVRADQKPSATVSATPKDFNNQIKLALPALYKPNSNLLDASFVLIRLPLQNGDFDLEIDQTNPSIGAALAECRPDTADDASSNDASFDSRTAKAKASTPKGLSTSDQKLIAQYEKLNSQCRGGVGDRTEEVCDARTAFGMKMSDAGLCDGKEGQSEAEMEWHRCAVGSNGYQQSRSRTENKQESEYGGAEPGMAYAEFRRRLISAGFKPRISSEKAKLCADDPEYHDCTAHQYKETDSCSGTGEAFCNYTWEKGTRRYIILTREGEGGQVVEMRIDR